MKVFLSYSVNDRDQYILTLLSGELNKQGFTMTQSSDFNVDMSELTKFNVRKSQLFIGLMTGTGREKKRVYKEWQLAHNAKKPTILLIENTVRLNPSFKFPYISFDRNDPRVAVQQLKREIEKVKNQQNQGSNTLAWILGGAALLAILNLLSDD